MYFTLPELPRNGTGKIDRAALRNLSSDQDGLASNEDSAYARQAV
jgi:acyl-coenzyme A synthetase/AMP-(fatty) acid ligase